jgi:hypothetical protein
MSRGFNFWEGSEIVIRNPKAIEIEDSAAQEVLGLVTGLLLITQEEFAGTH